MTNEPENQAAHNPDPEPDGRTMPLSGNLQPGETPPESDQVSAPQGHEEHGPPRWAPWVWIVAILVVAGLVVALFGGYAAGLLR
ncbi:DUF6480 family protein [Promicromonospora aerolata]|uniref:DUF6480 family protein n=1 Tax=Promicromonospora aerolata TaxID=195749 RepID=A0ABW4V475_9MICO